MNCAICNLAVSENDYRIDTYKDHQIVKTEHDHCRDKEEFAEFKRTGIITSNLMMKASLFVIRAGLHEHCVQDEVNEAVERLKEEVKRFEVEAWFGGVRSKTENHKWFGTQLVYPRTANSLQSIIEDSPHRTLVSKLDDVTVTGQEMAGRALIELENAAARFTLIAAAREQSPRMGIQGIQGTEEQCREMIHAVRENWRLLHFERYKP